MQIEQFNLMNLLAGINFVQPTRGKNLLSLSTDVKTIIASTAEPKLSRYNQMVLTSAAKSDLRTLRNFGPKKSLTLAPHSSELVVLTVVALGSRLS